MLKVFFLILLAGCEEPSMIQYKVVHEEQWGPTLVVTEFKNKDPEETAMTVTRYSLGNKSPLDIIQQHYPGMRYGPPSRTGQLTAAPSALTPSWSAFSDFNGDGMTDSAISFHGSDEVHVYLANGPGSIDFSANYLVGTGPERVRAIDLNRDGFPDLVTANLGRAPQIPGSFSILRNRGDGTFMDAGTLVLPDVSTVTDIGGADFNDDNFNDLVIGFLDTSGTPGLSVLFGNASGDYSSDESIPLESPSGWPVVHIADLNQDGDPDIVSSTFMLMGLGDGSFSPSIGFGDQLVRAAVTTADLNNDGHTDILGATRDLLLSTHLGTSAGQFNLVQYSVIGSFPESISADDLDGDGNADLYITYARGTSAPQIIFGNGHGSPQFSGIQAVPTVSNLARRQGAYTAIVRDMNGDELIDLVVANGGELQGAIANPQFSGTPAAIIYSQPDGTWSPPSFMDNQPGHGVAASDFNHDGNIDLAFMAVGAGSPVIKILSGSGDGTFSELAQLDLPGPRRDGSSGLLLAVDIDEDGHEDIVAATPSEGLIHLFHNDGNGLFSHSPTLQSTQGIVAVVTGDLNNDGHTDLVVGSAGVAGQLNGAIGIHLSDASSGAPTGYQLQTVRDGISVSGLTLNDVNADGFDDLLCSFELSPFSWETGYFPRIPGGGFGEFISVDSHDYQTGSVAMADVDLDGREDILVSHSSTVSVYRNTGSGEYTGWGSMPYGGGPIHFSDLDNDGLPDAIAASGSGFISILKSGSVARPVYPDLSISGDRQGMIELYWPEQFPDYALWMTDALPAPKWNAFSGAVERTTGFLRARIPTDQLSRNAFFKLMPQLPGGNSPPVTDQPQVRKAVPSNHR